MRSYAHGTSATPLLGETIGENLRRTVERCRDADALVSRGESLRFSWRALDGLVRRCARGLMARGVHKGDRVGIWAPNRHEWVVIQYATASIGAVLVNINPAYKTAELEYCLNQSTVSVLVTARAFRGADFASMVQEVAPRCPALRETIVLEDGWAALLDAGATVGDDELDARAESLHPDDPINIQYTSGTTGFPKGATLSHHNILNNGFFVGEMLRYGAHDRVCIPVPFYHCFGMVLGNLACTTHGACIVIPGEAFDPERVLEAVVAERCTALYGVPTMFIAVLERLRQREASRAERGEAAPRAAVPREVALSNDMKSLRTGIMAGSPCPVEVMRRVQSELHIPEMTICYGMTETSPVSTQTAVDDPLENRVSTVGRVHPHLEVKIVHPETGAVVERGQSGELCTRGYSVMLGYWDNPGATAHAIDTARWMHTGDLATMDADGYVNIVGRIKDMIIRGGENVYPREVEEFLYTHPSVSDVQVIGVPSEKYGEEVMAWVKPKPGCVIDGAELETFCRGRIATYKIPRYWKIVDGFPMTVTGKVQKFRMREIAVEELGLHKAAGTRTA
jgi:fatty-acyl-CoA synthase